MTGSANTPTATDRPRRKRQFPFGLVMLIFGLGLGFYGGVAATKRAMTSPTWIQSIFGVSSAVAPTAPAPASPTTIVTTPAAQPTAPTPAVPPASPPAGIATDTGSNQPDPAVKPEKPVKPHAADSRDLVGTWVVTDTLAGDSGAGSSVTSSYTFHGDNTGEFDSSGKKLYDFRWKPSGDELSIDFDGEGPDANQPWNAKLKWSLNDDRSVLTLLPSSGKDARAFVYSLGPGVYHHKP